MRTGAYISSPIGLERQEHQTDVTDPRGYIRRLTFNPNGYTLTDTRAWGEAEQQSDSRDRPNAGNFVTSTTNTHGDVTTTEIDDQGRVWRVTRLRHSGRGRHDIYLRPNLEERGHIDHGSAQPHHDLQVDAAGNRKSVIDALNHKTSFEYNAAGQLTAVVDALQNRTTCTEYAGPDLVKITDPTGGVTHRFYDAAGRRLAETDPAGQTVRFTYNVIGSRDPTGQNPGASRQRTGTIRPDG